MMFGVHLPTLNAVLNGTSAALLALGFYFIKSGNIRAHKHTMTAAFLVSSAFLVSYLTYHYRFGSTKFPGHGPLRAAYLAILLSHTLLAVVVAPMAITTFIRALRGKYVEHRKIARFTWPIWIYVSITGVVIYLMLYRMY